MTKTKLMETYTAEQLAEMEKLYRDITQCRAHRGEHLHSEEYLKILNLNRTISELQSEVEKYRKAFEDAKKERDCQIAEYQKKIEELKEEKESFETRLKLLKRERNDLREEVEKLNKTQDFSDLTPIEVANMLINAEGEYEHNPITKAFCGTDKGTYRIFDVSELRQIAEHLLVYCDHNAEAEE